VVTPAQSRTDDDVLALLDPEKLGRWMDTQHLGETGKPVESRLIVGGNQNAIFEVSRGDQRWILRRPPRIVPPGRNESMEREFRVLQALAGSDVPHPEVHALCTDQSVLGGTFYLMQAIDGWSYGVKDVWPAPYDTDLAARHHLAYELVGGIAKLRVVDWQARGLEGFGRPDGFHERQVDRWYAHLEKFRFRDIPGLEVAGEWLRANRPTEWTPGLMHGDYAFPNVLFSRDVPADLAAIVDWEMATIGDPLLDLAQLLMKWPEPGEQPDEAAMFDLSDMPSPGELVEHYERVSGGAVPDLSYYTILARFKLAIVLEGGYARYLAGETDNPKVAMYNDLILDAAAKAAELASAS